MSGCFDFLNHIYGIFGFDFHLKLSTRPENYLGELAVWDKAEKVQKEGEKRGMNNNRKQMLEDSLDRFCSAKGIKWDVDPGDGAFYGPKIDIVISDALRRKHQCATIQLDFQLPERFNLEYRTESNESGDSMARPVIIHRAILGSVERMMGIVIEHFAGKFPFWLSPRQIQVIPVAAAFFDYAQEITTQLIGMGVYADADLSDNTLNKKIRNAELAHYNFIFVVGGEEASTRSVNVRNRDDVGTKAKGKTIPLDEVLKNVQKLKDSKSLENKL